MTGPLLETKLYVPRLRRRPVARVRLSDRLRGGSDARLTLISAPAGFGKTTLLAEWLASQPDGERAVAWLSLDAADSHPSSFWAYLIAALQTVAPGVGGQAESMLQEPQPAPIETILATLLNDLSAMPARTVLVLDDYHLVDTPEIQAGIAFLLDHLPPRVQLVIATRSDPVLPLSRLRARGELVEIRAADLRFTPDEAAAYLNDVMGLDLTASDVAALEVRTEGWIAALQLAGLSMQGRDDVAGFIAGFAGDDRYIVDYLVEEVLQRQSDRVREFLLQTSILARMSGPLCDAVTGQGRSRATLEALERANLFLVPLDDRREWYRYHQLFADMLQARLLDEQPDRVSDLHRRASEWHEQNGDRPEAIRHAMAGADLPRAADLIELAIPATRRARQEATLRHWLESLPDEIVGMRPVLGNAYAGSILVRGETEGVEARLRDVARWLEPDRDDPSPPDGPRPAMVVVDEEAFRALPAGIAVHRAGLARLLGDVPGTIAHARRALELVSEDDHIGRGAGAALLAIAHWTSADLDTAFRLYGEAMERFEIAGYVSDIVGCAIAQADIRITQGRLQEAMRIYERGLRLAGAPGAPVLRGAADMHVGMSDILRERNELAAAYEHLRAARDLGDLNGLPQNPYRSRTALARIRLAEGDIDGAVELLDEAERVFISDFSPNVRPIAALRARVRLAGGLLPAAADWVRERGLSTEEDLTYLHEFEHATLARVLVAQGRRDGTTPVIGEALAFIARLRAAAEAGGRTGNVMDILIAEALAHHAAGDATAALASLGRAIELAEPEGYVRLFVDEGPPMEALLKLAARQANASPHVRRLLAAFRTADVRPTADQPLIEPLSERELDVLRLLGSELDGPDIARELSVSLNTVRTHTRNVYAKLGVNSRRAAVRRAAELGLLPGSRGQSPTA